MMHSTEATTSPGGEISRPVSPKTIPPHTGKTTNTDIATQPKIRPRPRAITIPPTKPTQPPSHHRSFSVSAGPVHVQTLDPRSLQELHNERSYLIHNLQKQSDRATRLHHRYATVEARLTTPTIQSPSETKKTTREASLLRAKIADTAQQEQLTLLRLGEIHLELQNRDRWVMMVHQHLLLQQQISPPWLATPYPASPYPASPYPTSLPPTPAPGVLPPLGLGLGLGLDEAGCQGLDRQQHECTPVTEVSSTWSLAEDSFFSAVESAASESMLSPLSPCFMPGDKGWDGVVFAEDIWSTTSSRATSKMEGEVSPGDEGDGGCEERGVECCQEEVVVMPVEVKDGVESRLEEVEGGERVIRGVDDADIGHCSDGDEDSEEDTQARTAKLKRVSLCFPMPLRARERRKSLPYQKSLWSALPSTAG